MKKPTELNIIIAGAFSEEEIADIEGFKNNPYLQPSNSWYEKMQHLQSSNSWYENMQQIIANNEGKQQQYGVPKYIISGELGEDEAEKAEIQEIIAQLAEIEKARLDFKDRL